MAELADEWASAGVPNIWGNQPVVQEMQSEGGAAGTLHGALQGGALTTTFTASQGLLLMIPNMFKIAGELTPTVFHVAARSIATQALSIFGDHSDVMAARATGFAMLASGSVQEAHDLALVAQAATLKSRIPFMHFFDGFRTSHELNTLQLIPDEQIRAMIDDDLMRAHRGRALDPETRSSAARLRTRMSSSRAARQSNTFYCEHAGHRAASDGRARLAHRARLPPVRLRWPVRCRARDRGDDIGCGGRARRPPPTWCGRARRWAWSTVRLYRPFSPSHFLAALPVTCKAVAVLDRTKEPGASGEPLYLDVVAALADGVAHGDRKTMPRVIGGRYGLSSKAFNPAHAKTVFEELAKATPKNGFTVGIDDDVTHTSLDIDPGYTIESDEVVRAVFYGLGADGTVGANKNSVKIIAENAGQYAQGYFVYDSKKSGSQTISHLRFGASPIRVDHTWSSRANFVACHQFQFLYRLDVLHLAAQGGTFLLNSPYGPDEVWQQLPRSVQQQIIDKALKLYVIDATAAAREVGLKQRTNTILQTCFFAISGVLPREQAIEHIKASIEKTYGKRGRKVVEQNFAAIDGALERLHAVDVPVSATSTLELVPLVPASAPDFVRRVTAQMMAGRGDEIRVSAMPVDGTFPSGTAAWEKRNIADEVPVWREDLCIQCGQCAFVCPHSVIRARYFEHARLERAPAGFKAAQVNTRGYPDVDYTLQFYLEDCTGCGLCVEACPAQVRSNPT
ncbi:MAG: 2-oxoacid:acceptor oxidoreductase family protein [Halioglobus sp.]|nr:2-oxoacid:acceptor oxidoreductase family protein [Halioglobus sp.]